MKKAFYLLLSLLFFLSLSAFSADNSQQQTTNQQQTSVQSPLASYTSILGTRKPVTVSDKKIQKIEKIVLEYVKNGADITSPDVNKQILDSVNKEFPLNPKADLISVNVAAISKEINNEAATKFSSDTEKLKDVFKQEADQKYKAKEIGTDVTVKYKQGRVTKVVEGKYFGLTHFNDGIKVGTHIIPIFDLTDADKTIYSPSLREYAKKEYIQNSIDKYMQSKKDFISKSIKDKIQTIVKENEFNGYIFAWSKWMTPDDVTRHIITYVVIKAKLFKKEDNKEIPLFEGTPDVLK